MDATGDFMASFLGSGAEGAGAGDVCPSSTGSDPAAGSPQAEVDAGRSIILGFALKRLGWLEAQPNAVPTQDGGWLATQEFLLVLAMELAMERGETAAGSRSREIDREHVA